MSKKEQLGAYWGKDALYFSIASEKNLQKTFQVPISAPPEFEEDSPAESVIGSEISDALRKSFVQNGIQKANIAFSLPTSDVIFRSFIIPHMQASEVRNVVEFESTKYIPFQLEELHYTYHALNIVDDGRKDIRILFIAVKKDKLAKYFSIFEHTGVDVSVIEPAYMSLTRTLTHKKMISKGSITALVEIQDNEGTIIIVDQNIPQFVREFQLYPKSEDPSKLSPDIIRARLFNETKISFDYYARQHAGESVQEIIILSNLQSNDLFQDLSNDYDVPIKFIVMNELLNSPSSTKVGFANAYGSCLIPYVLPSVKFNIPWKEDIDTADVSRAEPLDLKFLGSVLAGCLLITFLIYNFTGRISKTYKSKLSSLQTQLGPYSELQPQNLTEQATNIEKKVKILKNLRLESQVSYFLKSIPEMLPAGTWLTNITIMYNESLDRKKNLVTSMSLIVTGNAYKENVSQQFGMVDDLLNNFKNNEKFKEYFDTITLDSVTTNDVQTHTVTNFRISCKANGS